MRASGLEPALANDRAAARGPWGRVLVSGGPAALPASARRHRQPAAPVARPAAGRPRGRAPHRRRRDVAARHPARGRRLLVARRRAGGHGGRLRRTLDRSCDYHRRGGPDAADTSAACEARPGSRSMHAPRESTSGSPRPSSARSGATKRSARCSATGAIVEAESPARSYRLGVRDGLDRRRCTRRRAAGDGRRGRTAMPGCLRGRRRGELPRPVHGRHVPTPHWEAAAGRGSWSRTRYSARLPQHPPRRCSGATSMDGGCRWWDTCAATQRSSSTVEPRPDGPFAVWIRCDGRPAAAVLVDRPELMGRARSLDGRRRAAAGRRGA